MELIVAHQVRRKTMLSPETASSNEKEASDAKKDSTDSSSSIPHRAEGLLFPSTECVEVSEGIGPVCVLSTDQSSSDGRSERGGYVGGDSGGGKLILWPSGDSLEQSDKGRLAAFNKVLTPLLLGKTQQPPPEEKQQKQQKQQQEGQQQQLADILGFSSGPGGTTATINNKNSNNKVADEGDDDNNDDGVTVCLSRSDHLPETYTENTKQEVVANAWVGQAQRFLMRNRRLGSLGCFPKFAGHNWVDSPEYIQGALKNVNFGLGFEDCNNPVEMAAPPPQQDQQQQRQFGGSPSSSSSSFGSKTNRDVMWPHSPVAVLAPDGKWREPFAYAAINMYGPQCFHLGKVAKALTSSSSSRGNKNNRGGDEEEEKEEERNKRYLFQPIVASSNEEPVSGEIELSLRLWESGLSVGLFDCGFDPKKSGRRGRSDFFPNKGALGVDEATAFGPIGSLDVWKQLLLTGPAEMGILNARMQPKAAQTLITAAIANHRLFQQRQEALWPQFTALDYYDSPNDNNNALSAMVDKTVTEAAASGVLSTAKRAMPVTPPFQPPPPPPLVPLVSMMANAGCSADPLELPLPSYGNYSEGLTLVLMSYQFGATELPATLSHYIDVISRDLIKEVVLVWNSPLITLPKVVQDRLRNQPLSFSTSSSTTPSSNNVDGKAVIPLSNGVLRVVPFETNSLLNRLDGLPPRPPRPSSFRQPLN
jgi:hypothetical protein